MPNNKFSEEQKMASLRAQIDRGLRDIEMGQTVDGEEFFAELLKEEN